MTISFLELTLKLRTIRIGLYSSTFSEIILKLTNISITRIFCLRPLTMTFTTKPLTFVYVSFSVMFLGKYYCIRNLFIYLINKGKDLRSLSLNYCLLICKLNFQNGQIFLLFVSCFKLRLFSLQNFVPVNRNLKSTCIFFRLSAR